MRDNEGRPRHFVVRDKNNDDYDAPSVRRRAPAKERADDEEERRETPRVSRRRMTLRERELEEEEEARSRRTLGKKRVKAEPEPEPDIDEDEEEEHGTKAPRIVRVFAWIALMVILFACGYLATNYFFSWSDKRGGERIGSVYGTGDEVRESAQSDDVETVQPNSTYVMYVPDSAGAFQSRSVEIAGGGTVEDDIAKVMAMYTDSLKETKALDTSVSVGNIFRSGDWLYLDMTPSFMSSLKKLGKDKAEHVLCGYVRTAADNFPPVKKIKFYVDSKEITDKTPVDLREPWERTE